MPNQVADVIVVGAGNAAFCAALAAQEQGAKVLMLEAAPEDESGGNSRFTAGSIRVVYNGIDDIKTLVPDLTPAEIETTDFGTYTADQFFDDMARVTQHRADPDLVELLVTKSFESLNWMREKGVRLIPIYGRQAFKIDGKFKFWGGLTVESVGGGPGLVKMLTEAAKKRGIEIRYADARGSICCSTAIASKACACATTAKCANCAPNRWCSPAAASRPIRNGARAISAPAGTSRRCAARRFNTGDGIRMALDIGAVPRGNWSGCHAVQWEMNAPEFGDLAVGDQFQKHSYPFSILVNATGKRFVDEGADFRNYTYAKYGRVVLEQPGQFAWQIFDQKVKHLQRDEYRIRQITKVTANTIEEFAQKLEGVNAAEFLKTIKEWNAAVRTDVPFNPNVKDGRSHAGSRHQQEQLGEHHRRAAVRGLRRDLRRHLHLRRAAHQHRRRGAQHRLPADPRPLCRGRTGRRSVLLQLSGRIGPDVRHGVRQDRRHLGRPRRQELTMDAKVKRPLNELDATEIAKKIAAGETTCEAVVRDCVARIAARDDVVKAWVNFDPEARARPGARARSRSAPRAAARRADRRERHHRYVRHADRDGFADLSRPSAARRMPAASRCCAAPAR